MLRVNQSIVGNTNLDLAKQSKKAEVSNNDKETTLSFMGNEEDEAVVLEEPVVNAAPYNPNPAWQALKFMANFVGGKATGVIGMLMTPTPAYGGTMTSQHSFKQGGGVR